MTSSEELFDDQFPSDYARLIDGLCDLFEKSWKSGDPPKIETLLAEVPEDYRWTLLQELLLLDIQYRFRADVEETIAPSSYADQFPEFRDLIEELCHPMLRRGGGIASLSSEAGNPPVDPDGNEDQPTFEIQGRAVSRLNNYQLTEEIGRGGMGIVFKARHLLLNRKVALKVTLEEHAIDRFLREMECIGRLEHQNVANAYDASVDDIPYLVMEFVDGLDLRTLVKAVGPLSIPDACELMRQACAGLQYVHQNELVHRDIKPGNLMLSTTGQLKILDLGLARIDSSVYSDLDDMTGARMLGTLHYMAPEQASNSSTVDIRADLYSIGCTLFFLLTGTPPFLGSATAVLLGHQSTEPPDLSGIRDDVEDGLSAVLERLLHKSLEARPAAPADVEMMLSAFAEGADLPELARRARNILNVEQTTKMPGPGEKSDVELPSTVSRNDANQEQDAHPPINGIETSRAGPSHDMSAASEGTDPLSIAPEPAGTTESATEQTRARRIFLAAIPGVCLVSLVVFVWWSGREIPVSLSEGDVETSPGWQFTNDTVQSPGKGPAWLRLPLPESDIRTLHVNAERNEGQSLAIVVRTAGSSFALRFGAQIVILGTNHNGTATADSTANEFPAEWGDWVGDQNRQLTLRMTDARVQLLNGERLLVDEPVPESDSLDPKFAVPALDGVYLFTQSSRFTFRNAFWTTR